MKVGITGTRNNEPDFYQFSRKYPFEYLPLTPITIVSDGNGGAVAIRTSSVSRVKSLLCVCVARCLVTMAGTSQDSVVIKIAKKYRRRLNQRITVLTYLIHNLNTI